MKETAILASVLFVGAIIADPVPGTLAPQWQVEQLRYCKYYYGYAELGSLNNKNDPPNGKEYPYDMNMKRIPLDGIIKQETVQLDIKCDLKTTNTSNGFKVRFMLFEKPVMDEEPTAEKIKIAQCGLGAVARFVRHQDESGYYAVEFLSGINKNTNFTAWLYWGGSFDRIKIYKGIGPRRLSKWVPSWILFQDHLRRWWRKKSGNNILRYTPEAKRKQYYWATIANTIANFLHEYCVGYLMYLGLMEPDPKKEQVGSWSRYIPYDPYSLPLSKEEEEDMKNDYVPMGAYNRVLREEMEEREKDGYDDRW